MKTHELPIAAVLDQVNRVRETTIALERCARGRWFCASSELDEVTVWVDDRGRLRSIELAEEWSSHCEWVVLERLINDTVRRAVKVAASGGERATS